MKRIFIRYKNTNIYRSHAKMLSVHRLLRYSESSSSEPTPNNKNSTYFMAATIAGGIGLYGLYQYNSQPVDVEPEQNENPEDVFASYLASLPTKEVKPSDMLGEIDLLELNKYDCKHATKQLICVYGTVFDVSNEKDKYGNDGMYKNFAGHDITLTLGSGCLNDKYLDYFVQMNEQFTKDAKEWLEFYKKKYPVVGTLNKWNEDQTKWPQLTDDEIKELTMTQVYNPK
eukprot:421412_1